MVRSSESRQSQILGALRENLEVGGEKKLGQIPEGAGIMCKESQVAMELTIAEYREARLVLKERTEKRTTVVEAMGHPEKDILLELVLGRGLGKEFELLNEKQTVDEPGR